MIRSTSDFFIVFSTWIVFFWFKGKHEKTISHWQKWSSFLEFIWKNGCCSTHQLFWELINREISTSQILFGTDAFQRTFQTNRIIRCKTHCCCSFRLTLIQFCQTISLVVMISDFTLEACSSLEWMLLNNDICILLLLWWSIYLYDFQVECQVVWIMTRFIQGLERLNKCTNRSLYIITIVI